MKAKSTSYFLACANSASVTSKRYLKSLAELSGQCTSEFILEAALNTRSPDDFFHDLAIVLAKNFKEEKSFQQQ